MKKVIYIIALLIGTTTIAQTITVNGTPMLVSDDISFPFWLESGSSISPEVPVSSISVLEFNIVPNNNGNDMVFNQVISVTEGQTVPEGKTWKVESILMENQSFSVSSLNPNTFVSFSESGDNFILNEPTFYLDDVYFSAVYLTPPSSVIEYGFCYSYNNSLPSVYDNKLSVNGFESETPNFRFGQSIEYDSLNTKYVRAYSINEEGITYSSVSELNRPQFYTGMLYQDGVIFHVDSTGENGLIAFIPSITNETNTYSWCNNTEFLDVQEDFGSGLSNTITINENCNSQYNAASAALEFVSPSGYDDWYLPSRSEAETLVNNFKSKNFLENIGHQIGFQPNLYVLYNYWTSSQYDGQGGGHAMLVTYHWNSQIPRYYSELTDAPKSSSYYLLPIRNF